MIIGNVDTFANVKFDKCQALKPLEESAEIFAEWQSIMDRRFFADGADEYYMIESLKEECADVIQATCNLLAACGVEDFSPYMLDCKKRNQERGRIYAS